MEHRQGVRRHNGRNLALLFNLLHRYHTQSYSQCLSLYDCCVISTLLWKSGNSAKARITMPSSNLGLPYSSSSSSPASSFFSAALAFFRLTRPGRPPPNGEESAKSMCFWESRRTTKDGTLTICFPTLLHI